MNKTIFYTGISILVAPFLIYGLVLLGITLLSLDINLGVLLGALCGLAYFGVALYLIVRGTTEENGK